jgi:hypothetical protein
VIHGTSLVAVHLHWLVVVTAILPDAGEALTACVPGTTTNLHAVASGFAGDVGLELGPTTGDDPPQPEATVGAARTDRAAAT